MLLWHTWQSGAWGSLVMRLFSGFDTLFLVRSKPLSNNVWYSMRMGLKGYRAEGNSRMSSSKHTREPSHTTPSRDRQSVLPLSSARRLLRRLSRERRRIPSPRIIKIHKFLACHVGMDGSRCVGTHFLNTPCLRLEDKPIYPTNDLGMVPVKSRPFQRRRASLHINEQVVHCPAHPMVPDDLRKMASDGDCP